MWGRNLADDEYAVQAAESFQVGGADAYFLSDPRTYGATVRYALLNLSLRVRRCQPNLPKISPGERSFAFPATPWLIFSDSKVLVPIILVLAAATVHIQLV